MRGVLGRSYEKLSRRESRKPKCAARCGGRCCEVSEMGKKMRRKVDPLGRIVLPAEFRAWLGIEKDSEIEIVCEKDRMIIRKAPPAGVIIPLPRER